MQYTHHRHTFWQLLAALIRRKLPVAVGPDTLGADAPGAFYQHPEIFDILSSVNGSKNLETSSLAVSRQGNVTWQLGRCFSRSMSVTGLCHTGTHYRHTPLFKPSQC